MGSLRLTLCAGVVMAAALTLVPVPASAVDAADAGASVTPSNPAPGSDIQVRARGCTGTSGTAVSEAFVADALLAGRAGELVGETRVRSTATPGTYDVEVVCGGLDAKVTGTLTVVKDEKDQKKDEKGKPEAREQEPREQEPGPPEPRTHESPVAPVSAGGGGTARLSAVEERSEGPGTPHTVIGLILAGVAAVAVAVRGVRRGRGGKG